MTQCFSPNSISRIKTHFWVRVIVNVTFLSLNLFVKSTHCPFNFAAKGGLKKKEKKTRITRCVIVACRQTKIKRFDKRRRSVLEGVKRFIWSTFDPCQNILIRVLSRRQLMSSLISWLAIWTWLMRGTLLFFCVRRERICQEAHKSVNNYGNDHFPIKCWDMTWHFPAKEKAYCYHFMYNPALHTHTHTHTIRRGLHKFFFFFAGVAERFMQTGLQVFMNFPSATISAAEFPLVYPEVNNLWEDKSVCGRELDSQTVEGGWLGTPPPLYNHSAPEPLHPPPSAPPDWARPLPRGGLARYLLGRLLEVQICVPTCSRCLSACFPLVSSDWVWACVTLVPPL